MTSSYPPSTVAYPLLKQLLDSMPLTVTSTSSTFTLPPSSDYFATTTTSASTLPPISFIMSTDVQTFPPSQKSFSLSLPLLQQHFLFCLKMLSPRLHISSNILPSVSSPMICNKESHPKRPQLPPGEAGTPVRRIVHTAVYKQNLLQYNNNLKLLEL